MRIERNYYDQALKKKKKLEEEIVSERNKMTEEELEKQKTKRREDALELIKRAESYRKKKTLDHVRIIQFTHLQKKVLKLARITEMNIIIEKNEEDMYGFFEFSYESCWIVSETPKICVETMVELWKKSDWTYTSVQDNRVVQRFYFLLSEDINEKR